MGPSRTGQPPVSSGPDWPPKIYADLLESVPDALIVVDEEGEIQFANAQAELMFGYRRDALLGHAIEKLVPEELHQRHIDHRRRYVEQPSVRPMGRDLELRGVRRDGTTFPVEISLAPLVSDDGLLVVAAVRNVTEQRRERERFRSLLDAAPDATVIVDRQGRMVLVNDQVERLFGWTREELVGEPVEVLIPNRFRPDHPEHRNRYFTDPVHRPMGAGLELYALRKDGHEFPVEISLAPVQTDQGMVALAAIRDITDRRNKDEVLARYTDELQRSNQELQNFAYIASHDLQEPLRMVTGFLSVLEKRFGKDLDDEAKEFIGYAVDGAERMRQLIQGLLDYSRVSTQAKEPKDVDMGLILQNVLADLSARIEDKGARVELEGDLLAVRVDPTQVARVWLNLIGNALKFVPKGRKPIVRVRAKPTNGDRIVRFEVEDNGIGIPEGQRDRIFQIFQRLHTRDEYEGTGMGLAICRRIVERNGGEIGVEGAPDEGSIFWFTLPVAR